MLRKLGVIAICVAVAASLFGIYIDKAAEKPAWYRKTFAVVMSYASTELTIKTELQKKELFSKLKKGQTVLEVGSGTCPNFRFFPSGIHYIGLEPNVYMHEYCMQASLQHGLNLTDISASFAESMSEVRSGSVDVVVVTHVLCSVSDQKTVLKEINRVLKPLGLFLFIEHVGAEPSSWRRTLQNLLTPVWRVIGDGCEINRDTAAMISAASFKEIDIRPFELNGPLSLFFPHIWGSAKKL